VTWRFFFRRITIAAGGIHIMKTPSLFIALALAAGLSAAATAQAKPAVPTIPQLAAYPRMSSFTVSPDGKHIAGLEARGEDRVILVWNTDAIDKPPVAIGSKVMKIQAVQFIKNDQLAVHDVAAVRVAPRHGAQAVRHQALHHRPRGQDLERADAPVACDAAAPRRSCQALSNPEVLDRLTNDPDHILVVNDAGGSAVTSSRSTCAPTAPSAPPLGREDRRLRD
jgi:hypothetical protein